MSVTAVPIRPLSRGAVVRLWLGILVLALAAAALAWLGTRHLQLVTLDSGVRYRVLSEGEGPTITPADLFALRYKLRVNDATAEVVQDSDQMGQPLVASTQTVYPGFGQALQRMRAGGKYMIWVPPGQHEQGPLRPGTPFNANDTLVFEIEVLQIAPGMAAMQQLGAPPGAAPDGAPGAGAPPAPGGAPSEKGRAARPSRPEPAPGNSQR